VSVFRIKEDVDKKSSVKGNCKMAVLVTYFHSGALLALLFNPEDGDNLFFLNFNGLHGFIFQKIIPFITTGARI
jgi:hypothetical protein